MTTKPSLFWVDPQSFSDLIRRTKGGGASTGPGVSLPEKKVMPAAAPAASLSTLSTPVAEPSLGEAAPQAKDRRDSVLSTLPQSTAGPAIGDGGSLEQRLSSLLAWIRSEMPLELAFIVDQDGLSLVHEEAPLELVAAAAELAGTWDRLRDRFALSPNSFVSTDLANQSRLHLISIHTGWERISLGLVMKDSDPRPHADLIVEGFQQALSQKEPLAS